MDQPNRIYHQDSEKDTYSYRDKPKKKNGKSVRISSIDRRSGYDRRKSYSPQYFDVGGAERRNWKERRYLWFMTE